MTNESKSTILENTPKILRIKFKLKATAMVLSVLSLSWFFEGWRQISRSATPDHWALLVFGTTLTALLLWVQAYWIYIEEKSKGTLVRKVVHFDLIQNWLDKRDAITRLRTASGEGGNCD